MKLSELCKLHLKRLEEDDWVWFDRVIIDASNKQTLVNFKNIKIITYEECGEKYREDERIEIDTLVWFDKKGKIIMIDGRFSISFYGNNVFSKKILDLIILNELVDLDLKECSPIFGVTIEKEK